MGGYGAAMIKMLTRSIPAVFVAALMIAGPAAPARANTTSTLIGAAVSAIASAMNINANGQANAVVGILPNGDRVYSDGRAVAANGQTYYPGDLGQTLRCQNDRCTVAGTNGMYNGRRVGYQNHHGPNGRTLYGQKGPPPWAPAHGYRAHHGPGY